MPLYSSVREKVVTDQIASVALAIEALETILVEQGILRDNQVLEMMKKLMQTKISGAINCS